jgi:hypothetical protein
VNLVINPDKLRHLRLPGNAAVLAPPPPSRARSRS